VRAAAQKAIAFADRLDAIPAVGLPRVGPGLKRVLRELGVGYLSLDGQVYLSGGGILIDRRIPVEAPPGWVGESNIFSDKSSLLLRYLFSRDPVPLRIREVAAELGVSAGLVSRLSAQLKRDGYLVEENGRARLADRAALLDDWRELYRRRAKRQRERRLYVHARDVAAVMQRLRKGAREQDQPCWALSFQAGASLVAPYAFFSEVHALVGGAPWDEAADELANRFEAAPARDEANLVLVEPYYRHSWSYGLRRMEGLPVVSDIQLYLDLSVYPRRGEEQAERIRERILRPGSPKADS
jgi:DNA-binding MarR family transcriptional regulator